MDDEHDVEVFERIPWESLAEQPDRRWMAYVAAAAIVLGALGVSIGRQMGGVSPPVSSTVPPVATTETETAPSTTRPVTAAPRPEPTWSEADLMAVPAQAVERAALAVAEWYTVDFFTRDEPEGARSFVEWAGASQLEWRTPSTAYVTVLVRRLAATGGEAYRRLEPEAWRIGMRLEEEGWSVLDGPAMGDLPPLSVAGDGGEGHDGEVVEREWTDSAGITWRLRQGKTEGS